MMLDNIIPEFSPEGSKKLKKLMFTNFSVIISKNWKQEKVNKNFKNL